MAPTEPVKQSKYESFQVYAATHKTDEQKKEEVDEVQIGQLYCMALKTENSSRRVLTLSPPIPLRLYTLPYWSNSPYLIFLAP